FPGFDFTASVSSAFNSSPKKSQVIDPLYARIVGTNISTQPDATATKTEVGNLIDSLASCSGAKCADTHGVVKAACASMLGSAAMLVQ
ncbi:MAG TPA: LamG domain-containing protein, partial [Pseudomonadales bacterium]|nr:LamG domain-containing protein [Pseudomonadales bacterium]